MSDLWHNAPALNRICDLLFAAAALMVFYGAVRYAIVQPVFAIQELSVVGATERIQRVQVEAIAKRDIHGTFFTFDIVKVRNSFERLPWVRRADVRRQWPNGIEVVIETQQPLARWGKGELVNVQGDVFEGAVDGKLPQFHGPDGASREVTMQYERLKDALAAVGRQPVEVRMSPRGAWQVVLDNDLKLEMGREHVAARVERFLAAYTHAIAPLGHYADYVDLRYANGFAVRVRDLDKAKPNATRPAPRA
ncbi:MAG: FtsQ-type POTRA domain-containing protein [Betaproteobacteria bacterium]|nr:FtsQ-type POTRA domain-containing protein [Betaproteobacteria bacterium]